MADGNKYMAAMSIDAFLDDPVVRWTADRLEQRYNKNHDRLGRFAHSSGSAGAGGGVNYDRTLNSLPADAQTRIRTATDNLVAKYPATKNTLTVNTKSLGIFGPAGQTQNGVITLNRDWARFPKDFQDQYDKRVAEGFHPPAKDVYQAVMTHEFAHHVDDMTNRRASRDAEHELDGMRSPKQTLSDYLQQNLSSYSFNRNSPIDDYATLNSREAVAEAFQDVEMNGPAKAGPAAARLHGMLVHEYDNHPHPFYRAD